jgi:hypothetical protein
MNLDDNNLFKIRLKNGYKRREAIVEIFLIYFNDSRALKIITSGLSELLNHVTSLKPLLHLKSSLVSLMSEV